MEDALYKLFISECKLKIEYLIDTFENNTFIMERNCDVKIPDYLEIKLLSDQKIEDFVNIFEEDFILEIETIYSKLLSIPFRFMNYLKKFEVYDNKLYVTIPFKLFFNDIKLIALQHDEIKFKLINPKNIHISCKLISKGIYYNEETRNQIINISHSEIIQQLSLTKLLSEESKNEFICEIKFNGLYKGFYIECMDVDKIHEISLCLNDYIKFVYNRFFIKTKFVKINQCLLYMPFNTEKLQNDKTPSDFENSINFSKNNSSLLNIKLNKHMLDMCIYGLGVGLLRTAFGLCKITNNL